MPAAATAARRAQLHRRGVRLEVFTVAWNAVEGVVAIGAGIALGGAGAAAGGAVSGMIMAGTSYVTLSLAGGVLSLVLIPVLFWARRPSPTRGRSLHVREEPTTRHPERREPS